MSNLKDYFVGLLKEGKRLDGRSILDLRDGLQVEYGFTKTAEGSAKITLGDTIVTAGVKLEIMPPFPDTPDQGSIMVGAELIPLSNPDFELGPPSLWATELARVVDRGIREGQALNFKSFCITSGEKAWTVVLDIVPLNDDGNLIDTSALAALAALKDTKFPQVDGEIINYREKTGKSLEVRCLPIAVTVYKVSSFFIVDPTKEEEKLIDARLTITSLEDGTLCALQKGGDAPLSTEDISQMIDIALEKARILRDAL